MSRQRGSRSAVRRPSCHSSPARGLSQEEMLELRATLLQEHVWRQREGLVGQMPLRDELAISFDDLSGQRLGHVLSRGTPRSGGRDGEIRVRDQGGAPMSPRRVCDRLNPCSLRCSTASPHRAKAASCLARAGATWSGRGSRFSPRPCCSSGSTRTILNVLPLPDQLGAEGSALRWIERAEAIASWSWTATVEIGLVGSDLLMMIPLSIPSFSSTSASAALSILRSW